MTGVTQSAVLRWQRTKPPRDPMAALRGAAYHEAGHVLQAILEGFPVVAAVIWRTDASPWPGGQAISVAPDGAFWGFIRVWLAGPAARGRERGVCCMPFRPMPGYGSGWFSLRATSGSPPGRHSGHVDGTGYYAIAGFTNQNAFPAAAAPPANAPE